MWEDNLVVSTVRINVDCEQSLMKSLAQQLYKILYLSTIPSQ